MCESNQMAHFQDLFSTQTNITLFTLVVSGKVGNVEGGGGGVGVEVCALMFKLFKLKRTQFQASMSKKKCFPILQPT